MSDLNYHHLYYFWVVARERSIAAASRVLRLTPATISVQLKQFEERYGHTLLTRGRRGVELTEVGQMVLSYADTLFAVGRELEGFLEGRHGGRARWLRVGVTPILPKLVTRRLLRAAAEPPLCCHLHCEVDSAQVLTQRLVQHQLDLVISDVALSEASGTRVFHHDLGATGMVIMGTEAMVLPRRAGFPMSLDGAPMLLPCVGTSLRRSFDTWTDTLGLRPEVVGDFDDSGLLKSFGATGLGLFPIPLLVEEEVTAQYGVVRLGEAKGVNERFYAITAERQLEHPGVLAVVHGGRSLLRAGE